MAIRFELDPAKARRNVRRHGVSFEEATTTFDDDLSMTMPDPVHSVGESASFSSVEPTAVDWSLLSLPIATLIFPRSDSSLPVSPTRANATTMKKVRRGSGARSHSPNSR